MTDKIGESASPQADQRTDIRVQGLHPCPFCGSTAVLFASSDHSTAWEGGCSNDDCRVSPHVWELDKPTAIAAWNRRAAVAAASPAPTPTDLTIQSGPFKGKPQQWFARDQVESLLARAVLAAAPPTPPQAQPVAWRADWTEWRQYHDELDPLPAKWDSQPPPRITPLYASLPPAEPVREWVSVQERLPDGGTAEMYGAILRSHTVLTFSDYGIRQGVCVQWPRQPKEPATWSVDWINGTVEVTHWMPLPSPPVNAGRSIPPAKETTK